MAMLDRYKKTGGFVQLVALVETCGQAKQDKFLEIIRGEDAHWADAVKSKMLSIDKIYSWNDETLAEIFGTLQDLTVAIAFHAAQESTRTRIMNYFSHGRRRKIEDLIGTNKPTQVEVATMHMKIVESVRKMANEGSLRFDKFDPSLVIEEEIEAKLANAALNAPVAESNVLSFGAFDVETQITPEKSEGGASNEGNESRIMEIQALKKRVADLSKENAVLRHDLSIARSKLDQIKKIA